MVASTGMISDNLAGTAPSTATRAPGINNHINSSTSNSTSPSNSTLTSNPNLPSSTSTSTTTKDPGHTPSSSYANNVDAVTHTRGEKHASVSSDANGTASNGPSGVKKIVNKIGEKLSAGSSGSADPSLSAGSAMQGASGHELAHSARHPDQGLGHGHAGANLNRE